MPGLELTLDTAETVKYLVASTDDISGSYDKQSYRPPFSKRWRYAGDGEPVPETIRVNVELWGQQAEALIADLIDHAERTTFASSVFWRGGVEGLVDIIVMRIKGGGYRVTLEWLTVHMPDLGSVLTWQTWGQEDITFGELDTMTFGELP